MATVPSPTVSATPSRASDTSVEDGQAYTVRKNNLYFKKNKENHEPALKELRGTRFTITVRWGWRITFMFDVHRIESHYSGRPLYAEDFNKAFYGHFSDGSIAFEDPLGNFSTQHKSTDLPEDHSSLNIQAVTNSQASRDQLSMMHDDTRVKPGIARNSSITTSFFSFGTSSNVGTDVFFEGLHAYFEHFITFTDAHTYGYFYITPSNGSYRFEMIPFFTPNHTIASFEALAKPLFDRFSSLGIPVTPKTRHYPAFYPAFLDSWTQGPVGSYIMPANRLIPRANFGSPERFNRTLAVLRAHLESGRNVVGYHQALRNRARADNAVSSAWRAAAAFLISEVTAPASASPEEVREVAPASEGGGAYLNEAHPMERNWQREFYGEQYGRLLRIKRRWDPRDVFYATTAVGSRGVEGEESGGGWRLDAEWSVMPGGVVTLIGSGDVAWAQISARNITEHFAGAC
ncbi:hypothetical protein DL768_010617 [Monosporascus sp. mg162]|nr:hypothetical protein DL768_010617 [Monosporascus sp. mg162]